MKTIKLLRGELALVDDCFYYEVVRYQWRKNGAYVETRINGRITRLHEFIMDLAAVVKKDEIHHKDDNGLNNQISNLVFLTHAEHIQTKSAHFNKNKVCLYKGVSRNGHGWTARLNVRKQTLCLGTYNTPEEAAKAYNEAVLKHCSKYGKLNVI